MSPSNQAREFDFVIIGSGFGGSVSAMRLAQKGYSVAVLEEGRRWSAETLPRTNWDIRRYLWAPALRCFGIQAITLLRGLMVLHGKGVGGGSLVYANVLMTPKSEVFEGGSWPRGVSWWRELKPHYDTALRMLGVVPNPHLEPAELALREVGRKINIAHTFHATEVGVFFGEPEKTVDDPYFSGEGPKRSGCNSCGGCMVGCRYNAKNTLDRNYLYFAEKWGAKIFPETKAVRVRQDSGGYLVETRPTNSFGRAGTVFRAKKLVLAAGVLGSVELLFRSRDIHKTLPRISAALGHEVRTNGECLLGATSLENEKDYSRGIAIGAAIHPDEITKIEAVKYPSGSSFMRLLAVPLTPSGGCITRPLKLLWKSIIGFPGLLRLGLVRDWARRTVILLVMQSSDTKMMLYLKRGLLGYGLGGRATSDPVATFLPVAQATAEHLAKEMKGIAQNVLPEVLLATPATAHMLGGCKIGENAESAVVDFRHEVFEYPGLYVCDGSVIPSNLGVNPSLTIAALAERFASQFPDANPELRKQREIRFSPMPEIVKTPVKPGAVQ